jgi:hypothetical protein
LSVLAFLSLAVRPCHATAQTAKPQFRIELSVETVETGTHFEAVFVLENDRAKHFVPPALSNLRVVSGPVTGMRSLIINGVAKNLTTWTFYYEPIAAGAATIGTATATSFKSKYQTQPVTIEVTPPRPSQKDAKNQDVFIETVVSSKQAMVGQQVVVDYMLHTAINLSDIIVLRDTEWSNADFEELSVAQGITTKKFIGSKRYVSRLIKRVAVFPKSGGQTTATPLTIQISADKGIDPLFMRPRLEDMRITSPAVVLDVRTPKITDSLFTGIVGQLIGRSDMISPPSVTTQDLISLRIELETDAHGSTIWLPDGAFGLASKVVDVQLLKKERFERQGRLWENRIFEVTLQPLAAGTLVLQPQYGYLTTGLSYDMLNLAPITVQVSQKGLPAPETAIRHKAAALNPSQPSDHIGSTQRHRSILSQWWYWLVLTGPWLMVAGLFLVVRVQKGILNAQSLKPQWETLYTRSIVQLQGLPTASDTEMARQTYRTVLKIINIYAHHLAGALSAEHTAAVGEIAEGLAKKGIPKATIDRYTTLARQCERIVYAGQAPAALTQDLQNAAALLKQLRLDRKNNTDARAHI